jgi:hypothetical protein
MINFSFSISNPFFPSDRWKTLFYKDGVRGWKTWEIQVVKTISVIGFSFSWATRTDHAGVSLSLSVLGYEILLSLVDRRHWDDETGAYKIYDET